MSHESESQSHRERRRHFAARWNELHPVDDSLYGGSKLSHWIMVRLPSNMAFAFLAIVLWSFIEAEGRQRLMFGTGFVAVLLVAVGYGAWLVRRVRHRSTR